MDNVYIHVTIPSVWKRNAGDAWQLTWGGDDDWRDEQEDDRHLDCPSPVKQAGTSSSRLCSRAAVCKHITGTDSTMFGDKTMVRIKF